MRHERRNGAGSLRTATNINPLSASRIYPGRLKTCRAPPINACTLTRARMNRERERERTNSAAGYRVGTTAQSNGHRRNAAKKQSAPAMEVAGARQRNLN